MARNLGQLVIATPSIHNMETEGDRKRRKKITEGQQRGEETVRQIKRQREKEREKSF